MKKRILGLICSLTLILGVLGGAGVSKSASSAPAESQSQVQNPVVLLNGYEDQGDLNTLMLYDYLGKVELNSDKTYVKNGEKSGKISVMPDLYNGRNKTVKSYLYQATRNVSKGVIENDFKKTVGVGFSIYNANSEVKTIGVRLVYYRNYNMGADVERIVEYDLEPGKWTEVYLNVVREKISLRATRYGDNTKINLVTGYDILFSNPDADKTADIFYIDDARLYKTTEDVVAEEKKEIGAYEICSFDSEWQINSLGYSNHTSYFTGVEWSKSFTTDGGGSLKILTGGGTTSTYFQINRSAYFSHIDMTEFSDEGSLKMEFYSPAASGYSGSVTIWLFSSGNGLFFSESFIISPGNVTYIDLPISHLKEDSRYDPNAGNSIEYLGKVQISVSGTATPFELYLDNVRLEKAGA